MNLLIKLKAYLKKKNPNICVIAYNSILKIELETYYNLNLTNNYIEADIIILSGVFTSFDKNSLEKKLNNKVTAKFIIYKNSNINIKNSSKVIHFKELKDCLCL